ncbi:MAG: hypothetical protein QOH71_255 [Blastocatellia bacterium]|jgi:hypothetical protein|nr:hypothetical protein [Blastocatellia bacterium]
MSPKLRDAEHAPQEIAPNRRALALALRLSIYLCAFARNSLLPSFVSGKAAEKILRALRNTNLLTLAVKDDYTWLL